MPPVPPGKPLVAFIPGRTGVIQGSFIGGKPRVLMPAAPPAPATVQRKIATIPTAGATTRGPGLTSPRIPPTLPATGRGSLVQASTDNSFRLPDTVVLRPPGVGQRLPDGVRSQMEAVFHADFSDVRVLVGHEAPSIGALAFTHGTDLYFAPGRYAPETPQGRLLLGHELTHVVQQARGGPRTRSGVGSPWSRTGRWRMRRIAWPGAASAMASVQAKLGEVRPATAPLARPGAPVAQPKPVVPGALRAAPNPGAGRPQPETAAVARGFLGHVAQFMQSTKKKPKWLDDAIKNDPNRPQGIYGWSVEQQTQYYLKKKQAAEKQQAAMSAPKVKDDYSDLDAKYKVQAEPTITTHSNSPSYTPHVPQLPQGFSVNINPQPTQGQLLSAQTPEHQIPKAWENTDITQLVSVTSAPTSLQLGAAVKLNDKCTADTKYWSFAAIWQRVDKRCSGTLYLHFHPDPISHNYLHVKRTDGANPTVGQIESTHWLIAAISLTANDVTPQTY